VLLQLGLAIGVFLHDGGVFNRDQLLLLQAQQPIAHLRRAIL
jgi:hypothetical protein